MEEEESPLMSQLLDRMVKPHMLPQRRRHGQVIVRTTRGGIRPEYESLMPHSYPFTRDQPMFLDARGEWQEPPPNPWFREGVGLEGIKPMMKRIPERGVPSSIGETTYIPYRGKFDETARAYAPSPFQFEGLGPENIEDY